MAKNLLGSLLFLILVLSWQLLEPGLNNFGHPARNRGPLTRCFTAIGFTMMLTCQIVFFKTQVGDHQGKNMLHHDVTSGHGQGPGDSADISSSESGESAEGESDLEETGEVVLG